MEFDDGLQCGLQLWKLDELQSHLFVWPIHDVLLALQRGLYSDIHW